MDLAFTILFILTLIYEAVALWAKRRGDTISEKTVSLREWRKPLGRVIFDSFYVWYGYHIIIDPYVGNPGPSASWIDLVIVAMVAIGTVLWWGLGQRPWETRIDPPTPKG